MVKTVYFDINPRKVNSDGFEVTPTGINNESIETPSELEGRDFSLIHYYTTDDVSLIVRGEEAAIGTYIITGRVTL